MRRIVTIVNRLCRIVSANQSVRIWFGVLSACVLAACSSATADACREGSTQRSFDKCVAACGTASHTRSNEGGGSSVIGDILGEIFARSGGPCVDNCRETYRCYR